MKRAIREAYRPVLAILGLATVAAIVGLSILNEQGLRFPWLEERPVRMQAVFTDANAVTPGQGQQVSVAGVQIGKIADVDLRDGRAVIGLDIDSGVARSGLIRTDAQALLRPRTQLNDMYVQVLPGSRDAPAARDDFEIPLRSTRTDVDLDEILGTLDERTRDYLALLVNGTGAGLKGNGDELAEVFKRFGPTARDLGRVNRALAQEREALQGVVTSYASLNRRLAAKPEQLTRFVSASNAALGAFAAEDVRLRETVRELPATLSTATATLQKVGPFAGQLGGVTEDLVPTMRALTAANAELRPFARRVVEPLRDEIRPFAREARPVVRDLAPAADDLAGALPEARRAGKVLNTFVNMLAFNRDGGEGPDDKGRDEGYLFWLGWLAHMTPNLVNVDDANGPMRPIFLTGTCGTLTSLVNDMPALEFAAGLSPVLATLCGNPRTRSIGATPKAAVKEGSR